VLDGMMLVRTRTGVLPTLDGRFLQRGIEAMSAEARKLRCRLPYIDDVAGQMTPGEVDRVREALVPIVDLTRALSISIARNHGSEPLHQQRLPVAG
jgi:hypothetical protein